MKKLKDLKENECIRISSKREAKWAKKAIQSDSPSTKLLNKYIHKVTDGYGYGSHAASVILPASDFIRPSVKEQLRQLSDRVGKLEAIGLPVVDEQHVKEYSVSEPYNRAAVMQSKNEEEWVDICKGSRETLDSKLAASKELTFKPVNKDKLLANIEANIQAKSDAAYINPEELIRDIGISTRELVEEINAGGELTELPEKWALKCRDKEQAAKFERWVKSNKQTTYEYQLWEFNSFYFHYPNVRGVHSLSAIEIDYTEITFEQFEKWVLNVPASPQSGQLEVNKWYTNNNALFYVTSLNKKDFFAYGFDYKGVWHNDSVGWGKPNNDGAVEATHAEVEAALIGEAKRRYVLGESVIKSFASGIGYKMNNACFEISTENYNGGTDVFGVRAGGCCVYANGLWAEVIAAEPEIDWSVPQKLISQDLIVQTDGKHSIDEDSFNAMVINNITDFREGTYTSFGKDGFKKYNGKLEVNAKD